MLSPRIGIFVCHRRNDSRAEARALVADLRPVVGSVFLDVDDIGYGASIPQAIAHAMSQTALLVALIGRNWLEVDEYGQSRLNDPDDFINLEIRTAISTGVRVLPVLVDGASMPPRHAVPQALWPVLELRAMPLRHDDHAHDTRQITAFASWAFNNAGLGFLNASIGSKNFARGQRVRLRATDARLSADITGSTGVVVGKQAGTVVGVAAPRVLVRFDGQKWTRAVAGKSTLVVKVDLPPFDAWVPAGWLA